MTEIEVREPSNLEGFNFSDSSKIVMSSAVLATTSLQAVTHIRPEILFLCLISEDSVSSEFKEQGIDPEIVESALEDMLKPKTKIEYENVEIDGNAPGEKETIRREKEEKTIGHLNFRLMTNVTRNALFLARNFSSSEGRFIEPSDIFHGLIRAEPSYVHDILNQVGYNLNTKVKTQQEEASFEGVHSE